MALQLRQLDSAIFSSWSLFAPNTSNNNNIQGWTRSCPPGALRPLFQWWGQSLKPHAGSHLTSHRSVGTLVIKVQQHADKMIKLLLLLQNLWLRLETSLISKVALLTLTLSQRTIFTPITPSLLGANQSVLRCSLTVAPHIPIHLLPFPPSPLPHFFLTE